jgi:hypothetical protein
MGYEGDKFNPKAEQQPMPQMASPEEEQAMMEQMIGQQPEAAPSNATELPAELTNM